MAAQEGSLAFQQYLQLLNVSAADDLLTLSSHASADGGVMVDAGPWVGLGSGTGRPGDARSSSSDESLPPLVSWSDGSEESGGAESAEER